MEFEKSKFKSAKFKDRIFKYPVPELKGFFKLKKGEKPVWTIRGLTAPEVGNANDARIMNKNIKSIVEKLLSNKSDDIAEAVQEAIGVSADKVPDDIVWRIRLLRTGSVNPECDQQMAVKISNAFPETFFGLTNKIVDLTGMGQELGE